MRAVALGMAAGLAVFGLGEVLWWAIAPADAMQSTIAGERK